MEAWLAPDTNNVIKFAFSFLLFFCVRTNCHLHVTFFFIGCGRAQQPAVVHRYFSLPNRSMWKLTAYITRDVGTRRSTLACSPKPLSAMYSGVLGSEVAGNSVAESCSNGATQCAEWKMAAATTTPWTSSEYTQQQERSPQPLSYSATADVYMQTLCPSYTMLTYTHAPLLTKFGVSPTWIGKPVLIV